MRPYKVEYLMGDDEEASEDIFELVGILVHSGTAESGHYYSYIRERPSTSEKESWIEFNDDVVSPFEPNNIESCCFGGIDYRGPADNIQYDKSYSAYMLFYQRSSVLAAQKQELVRSGADSPIRLPTSIRLSNHIAMENELQVRKYCLYDPSHAALVTDMVSHLRKINPGRCSVPHVIEKHTIYMALDHLDQVIARTKDVPNFAPFIAEMKSTCQDCADCSQDFLLWIIERPEGLRHLLLRNPDTLVRSEMANMILSALVKTKQDTPFAYGFSEDSDSSSDSDASQPEYIHRVVKALDRLWDMFHCSCRAWPEYFGLLSEIAKLGNNEAVLLLDTGFLDRTLCILLADHTLESTSQYVRMLNIISKRMATRPVSYEKIIELLSTLLQTTNASLDTISDEEERLPTAIVGEIPLAHRERQNIMLHWSRGNANVLVGKLVALNQNVTETYKILSILLHWPDSLDRFICAALTRNIRKASSSTISSGVFLRAALFYCEESESARAIPDIVLHVARTAGHLENTEGEEYLQFFKDVLVLPSNFTGISREDIAAFCMEQIPTWAPRLLTYYNPMVRAETEDFINDVLLKPIIARDDDLLHADLEVHSLAGQKLGLACLEYMNDYYIRLRQQAVRPLLQNIYRVVDSCVPLFDEDAEDVLTRRFIDSRVCKSSRHSTNSVIMLTFLQPF